jgi:hypothetical protein
MALFFSPSVRTRYYFSSYHLWAASHFARMTSDLENQSDPNFNIQHRAYATNAILSSATFLEAAVNEVFDDAIDNHRGYIDPLSEETRRCLSDFWASDKNRRRPTLKKYRKALGCANQTLFDESGQPLTDARLLIELRNSLTHAHTKTQESGDMDDLAMELSRRFEPHRHIGKSANPYFPDKCLGAGCAEWAVVSARSFADEFFGRLRLVPNYQRADFGPI